MSEALGDSRSTDDSHASKGPSVDSKCVRLNDKCQSRWFQNKVQQPSDPAAARDSPGTGHLKVQLHQPLTTKLPFVQMEEQPVSVDEQLVDGQRSPSVQGQIYTELFIQEEDEDMKDKEERVRELNGRLSPQVVHGDGRFPERTLKRKKFSSRATSK